MATESAAVSGAPASWQVDGQGPEEERDRLRLEHRHRRRLDGARVLARGDARASSSPTRASACTRPPCCSSSFIPMLLVASAYKYLNSADPDAGTTFAWTTRAFGPGFGLAERLGDLPRRRARDGLAGRHRRDLHLQALRLHRTRRIQSGDHHRRGPLDLADDLDLLPRHRALRAHPAGAARLRGLDPRDLRGRRARRRSTEQPAGGSIKPPLVWFNPFAMNFSDLRRRDAAGRLHLLGLGLRRRGQRGVRGLQRGARAAAVVSTLLLVVIYLVVSAGARPSTAPASSPTKKTRKTC